MRQGADRPCKAGATCEYDRACTDRLDGMASGWQRYRRGSRPMEKRLASACGEAAQHAAVAPALLVGLPGELRVPASIPC